MTATNTMKTAQLNTPEYHELINPMIDSDGDSYRVSGVLHFISSVLRNETVTLTDPAESFGLAVILDTCAAALRSMQDSQQ